MNKTLTHDNNTFFSQNDNSNEYTESFNSYTNSKDIDTNSNAQTNLIYKSACINAISDGSIKIEYDTVKTSIEEKNMIFNNK